MDNSNLWSFNIWFVLFTTLMLHSCDNKEIKKELREIKYEMIKNGGVRS